jgi:hypothetical protein
MFLEGVGHQLDRSNNVFRLKVQFYHADIDELEILLIMYAIEE